MLDRDQFLSKYNCADAFDNSGLDWNVLEAIYSTHTSMLDSLQHTKDDLLKYIQGHTSFPVHSLRGRIKDGEHIVEKIIRKCGIERSHKYSRIDSENYMDIIHDIIGIRILYLEKEDWEQIHNLITNVLASEANPEFVEVEKPVAYSRFGDRNIYGKKIRQENTNLGYRSQHYIIRFNGVHCEIQTRTLAEEVYGEFDHKIKYPYRNSNRFLKRYTNIVSQHLDAVDEMISTALQMNEATLNACAECFEEDDYLNWNKMSTKGYDMSVVDSSSSRREVVLPDSVKEGTHIIISRYLDYKFLQKGHD